MNVWRERLGRWFTPLAQRVPLSPNAISLIAFLLNAIGAWCFVYGARDPRAFLVAIVFVSLGGLADALDGVVARVKGLMTRYGDFLDHFLDRVSDTLLLVGWVWGNGVRPWLVVSALVAISLNGYIGTQLEATFHQRNYDTVGRAEFVLGLIVFPIVSYILATSGWSAARYATLTIAEWMTALLIAFALLGIAQRFALAAKLERQR
ncbi:MAG: phosphatidylglycerophosphate synthase [Acidobacteria bacterium]|nr:phosphatidylglycerophosphate synthase [Acidobacteriota bacterium]